MCNEQLLALLSPATPMPTRKCRSCISCRNTSASAALLARENAQADARLDQRDGREVIATEPVSVTFTANRWQKSFHVDRTAFASLVARCTQRRRNTELRALGRFFIKDFRMSARMSWRHATGRPSALRLVQSCGTGLACRTAKKTPT